MARESAGPVRRHLFEFEDLGWFPNLFRNAITDWLAAAFTDVYLPVVPLMTRLLEHEGTDRVVDLCSGGSGPWVYLKAAVDDAAGRDGSHISLTLTDRFPNVPGFTATTKRIGRDADFRAEPVDARQVPPDLKGVRTIFTAFHHLKPADARAVLADAAGAGHSIGVFEHPRRNWKNIRAVSWIVPVAMLRGFNAWRPKRFWQLPLAPLIVVTSTWDAVVSQLRAYTPAELEAMTRGLGDSSYRWETGTLDNPAGSTITYLIGYPILAEG